MTIITDRVHRAEGEGRRRAAPQQLREKHLGHLRGDKEAIRRTAAS